MLGSPLYMPPEVIHGEKYDAKADVWSACSVVYIMLSGQPPFIGNAKDEVYKAITENELQFPDTYWKSVSRGAKEFLTMGMRKK